MKRMLMMTASALGLLSATPALAHDFGWREHERMERMERREWREEHRGPEARWGYEHGRRYQWERHHRYHGDPGYWRSYR